MAAPSHVFTIARVARMIGEDQAWLQEIALELEPEDGRLYVCDLDDDDLVTAFTPFGIENLKELVAEYKAGCRSSPRVATPRASSDAYGVEAARGEARAAVDGGLQVDLADRLEVADEEGIDGHQIAAVVSLDVSFAELLTEVLERRHLLLIELHDAVGRGLLQSHQPVVLAEQAVAAPHVVHPGRRDLDAGHRQLAGDPQSAVAGMGQAMVEDRLLDVLADPVGMRVARAGDPVEKAVDPVGLEVAPNLVELLAAVADDAAGRADIAKLAGELEQSELAPCYLLLRVMSFSVPRWMCFTTPS